jgi:hypothetical protein
MSMKKLTSTKVGQPISHGGVSIFPLYLEEARPTTAVVADDSLQVSELESATVPQLQVTNTKDIPVIIPAGRVLEGGRQTRTVNVSILVPAGANIIIPVSCVEVGRWHGGMQFRDSKRIVSRKVRMAKQRGVKGSLDLTGMKYSDQGAVWNSISEELTSRHIQHASGSYLAADSYFEQNAALYEVLAQFEKIGIDPGQTGIAIAYGDKVAGIELFTNTDDFGRSWESLVRAAVLDSPADVPADATVGIAAVEKFLAEVAEQDATEAEGTGLGTEYHVANEHMVAHVLVDDSGALMHAYAYAEI